MDKFEGNRGLFIDVPIKILQIMHGFVCCIIRMHGASTTFHKTMESSPSSKSCHTDNYMNFGNLVDLEIQIDLSFSEIRLASDIRVTDLDLFMTTSIVGIRK